MLSGLISKGNVKCRAFADLHVKMQKKAADVTAHEITPADDDDEDDDEDEAKKGARRRTRRAA